MHPGPGPHVPALSVADAEALRILKENERTILEELEKCVQDGERENDRPQEQR